MVVVVVVILEKEGAVMQHRGVPSLPSAVTIHGFVYNYALQNDLLKKTYHLNVKTFKKNKFSISIRRFQPRKATGCMKSSKMTCFFVCTMHILKTSDGQVSRHGLKRALTWSSLGHFWAVMTPRTVSRVNPRRGHEILQCGRISPPHSSPF